MLTTILTAIQQVAQHLALTTFVFPDARTTNIPNVDSIPIPENVSAIRLPYTPNVLSFPHDLPVTFTVPLDSLPEFLKALEEISDPSVNETGFGQRKWVMRSHHKKTSYRALKLWLTDISTSLVNLIEVYLSILFVFLMKANPMAAC